MASVLEQFTNNGPLPIVGLVSAIIIGSVFSYVVASRLLFSSSKSKSTSSKQSSNKEKDTSGKKNQQQDTSAKKKNANNKAKKSTPAPVKNVEPSASSSSPSDESEEEQTPPVQPTKKTATANKGPSGKKVPTDEESNKSNVTKSNAVPVAKQQPTSPKKDSVETSTAADGKKKQTKSNGTATTVAPAKVQGKEKDEVTTKSNTSGPNKKQISSAETDSKRTPADNNQDNSTLDQDDEGQWVTQSSKQVSNRNRNKAKTESSPPAASKETTSAVSNRKNASEKRSVATNQVAESTSAIPKGESNTDTVTESPIAPTAAPVPEPIEICQLLPTRENPYTASDDWWKHTLNIKQNFTVDDIGEWPENDVDEQYIVNVKRFIPTRVLKPALTEKDINVGLDGHGGQNQNGNSQRRPGKLDRDDDKKFDDQKNAANVNSNESTATTSHSKKKTNVR